MSYKLKNISIKSGLEKLEACELAIKNYSKFNRGWKKLYDNMYGPRLNHFEWLVWSIVACEKQCLSYNGNISSNEYQFLINEINKRFFLYSFFALNKKAPITGMYGFSEFIPFSSRKRKSDLLKEVFTYPRMKEALERKLGKPKSEWVHLWELS